MTNDKIQMTNEAGKAIDGLCLIFHLNFVICHFLLRGKVLVATQSQRDTLHHESV